MFSITTLKRANVNGFMPLHDITCFFKPVKLVSSEKLDYTWRKFEIFSFKYLFELFKKFF